MAKLEKQMAKCKYLGENRDYSCSFVHNLRKTTDKTSNC
jgi:hypothetical protein